jgi:hypothetical protein|tara:strand:+ start:291 stop:527 length:237 start_codon:yes stop_codon:yes gene_type:complete
MKEYPPMSKKTRRNLRAELTAMLWEEQEKKVSNDQILERVGQLKTFQNRSNPRKQRNEKSMTQREEELLARWVLDHIS